MKPVYIIGSNKGGVGKSLLTMALLDYFSQIEQSCFLVGVFCINPPKGGISKFIAQG